MCIHVSGQVRSRSRPRPRTAGAASTGNYTDFASSVLGSPFGKLKSKQGIYMPHRAKAKKSAKGKPRKSKKSRSPHRSPPMKHRYHQNEHEIDMETQWSAHGPRQHELQFHQYDDDFEREDRYTRYTRSSEI